MPISHASNHAVLFLLCPLLWCAPGTTQQLRAADSAPVEHVLNLSAPFASHPGFQAGASGPVVSLGPAGHVLGKITLVDPSFTQNLQVLFLLAPGTQPEVLIGQGDLVDPGQHPSMQWVDTQEFYVSDSGSICMLAKVNDPSKSALPLYALIAGDPSNLRVVCYDGQLEAGPAGYISAVQLSSAGRLAFVLRGAVWFDALDEAFRPLVPDAHYEGMPGGSLFSSAFSPLRLNSSDAMALQCTLLNPGGGGAANYTYGVFVHDDTGLRSFLTVGSPAPSEFPGASIGYVTAANGLFFTDSGRCAARVFHTGSPNGTYDGLAIYTGLAGGPRLVVCTRMAGIPAAGTFGNPQLHGLSDSGDVLIQSPVNLDAGGAPDSCWRWKDGNLELLLIEQQATTMFQDGVLRDLRGMGISPDGKVVVHAASFSEHALLIQDAAGQPVRRLLGSGDAFLGPAGDEQTIDSIRLEVPTHGRRFDAQGRILTRIQDLHLRATLAWVDPAQFGGNTPFGSFSGRVLDDVDQSGDVSPPDTGIPDAPVKVFLADDNGGSIGEPLATYRTDSSGYYLVRLAPGDYVARYTSTRAPDGAPGSISRQVTIVPDSETTGVDLLDPYAPAQLPGIVLSLLSSATPPVHDSINVLLGSPSFGDHGGLCADGKAALLIAIQATNEPLNRPLRWECVAVRGGSVAGGLPQHVRRFDQDSQDWEATTPAASLIRTGSPEHLAPGHALLRLEGLQPQHLTFTGDSPEIEVLFRVLPEDSNDQAAAVSIKLRRPPVFLIPSDPTEGWGEEFLHALHASRHAEFVQQLAYAPLPRREDSFYYEIAGVLTALDWSNRVRQIRSQWAMVHPDIIAHGQGGAVVLGLSLADTGTDRELDYRNRESNYLGRYRAAVLLGTSLGGGISRANLALGIPVDVASVGAGFGHAGIVQSYAAKLHARLAELGESLGQSVLAYIPGAITKVPSWSAWLQRDQAQTLPIAILGPNRKGTYDDLAPIHLMTSRIPAVDAQVYRQIGFNALARQVLTPLGADGVVAVESALLVPADEFSENDPTRTVLPDYLAHGDDAFLFGEVPKQTHSAAAAQAAVAVLDRNEPSAFLSAHALSQAWIAQARDEALKLAVADYLIDLAIRPVLARLQPVTSPIARQGTEHTYTIELAEVPGEPLTEGPFWFAEVYRGDGTSSDGLTVTPDSSTPMRVSVTVAGDVIGDVVLYASYETGAGTVLATPIRLSSTPPEAADPVSLTFAPQETTLDIHGSATPAFWVRYSDGSTMRRWLLPEEFTVSSSAPAVLDVGNPTRWAARSEGQAVVTVNHAGLTAQTVLSVVNPHPPLSYSEWREHVFDATALADPLVSGENADADGDSVPTLFEYMAQGDPLTAEAGLRPRIEQVDLGDGPQPAFIVRLATRLDAEQISAQRSVDLETWQTAVSWTGPTRPKHDPAVLAVLDLEDAYEVWVKLDDSETTPVFYRLAVRLE